MGFIISFNDVFVMFGPIMAIIANLTERWKPMFMAGQPTQGLPPLTYPPRNKALLYKGLLTFGFP